MSEVNTLALIKVLPFASLVTGRNPRRRTEATSPRSEGPALVSSLQKSTAVNSSRFYLPLLGLLLVTSGLFLTTRSKEEATSPTTGERSDIAITLEEQAKAGRPPLLEELDDPVQVDTPYGAWLGVMLTYQVEFESNVDVISGDTAQSIRHTLYGNQQVKITGRTHEGAIATYSWPEIELELIEDGVPASLEETKELTRELRLPVQVYYDLEGRQQSLCFTRGVSQTTRNWVRRLVASQHGPVPEESPLSFNIIEANASGLSRVHYLVKELSKDAAIVSRSKLEALDGVSWGDGVKAPTVSGDGVITLSRGWTLSVNWNELSTLELKEAELSIKKSFTAEVNRTSVEQVSPDDLVEHEFELEWRSFDGLSDTSKSPNQSHKDFERALISEADAQTVINSLVEMERAHEHSENAMIAVDRLVHLITNKPEVLRTLQQNITSGSLPEWTNSKVLGAIAAAGTPNSQKLLRVLFNSSQQGSISLDSVAFALSQLEKPNSKTIDFFRGRLENRDLPDAVRDSSWQLLGLYAKTSEAPDLVAELISMETKADEAGELNSWLDALGNTCSADAFGAIKKHLTVDNVELRVRAVRALRGIKLNQATEDLIALGRTEEEPLVRGEALKALSEREEDAATQALAQLLQDEPQVKLRRAAVEVLAQRPLSSELIVLLSAITTSDPDILLRAYALSLLGG